ncbi:nuclear transport factor 2 family protein [Kribbella jejuensis]|uniref:Uncharacterized protein DUF4440 n=1 Tax=Kribbella jejuensis TaxID=236068 RepID=A0A542EKY9_9ACTN|nr:nuclear transport factor 2 family protein [Kribbella jejuensis]TQJ16009.1 uncharacterized protein DUF4440 [Kribbella jejuensis]
MSKINSIRTETDLVDYLTRYPVEVAFGSDPPEDVFDRYHREDFLMVNDGVSLDRQRLIAHVRPARKRATSVEVEVHDAVVGEGFAAARYTLTATMRKGSPIVTEIRAFSTLAEDGRLLRTEQFTDITS